MINRSCDLKKEIETRLEVECMYEKFGCVDIRIVYLIFAHNITNNIVLEIESF